MFVHILSLLYLIITEGTHGGTCSSTVGDSSCLFSLKCTANQCQCPTPATQYFDTADNTCKTSK